MKTILKLLENPNTAVYVRLPDEASGVQFLQQAENAGFRFGDGAKPTGRACGSVMALHSNRTICYVGVCGHIAFGCAGEEAETRQRVCLQFRNGKFV